MSYILDALRKADHERSIGDLPDLDTPHWSQRHSGPVRYWLWALIALLMVNGALFALLFSRDNSDDGASGVSAYMPGPQQGRAREVPQAQQRSPITRPQQPDSLPPRRFTRPLHNEITVPRQALPAVVEPPQLDERAAAGGSLAPAIARPPPARLTAAKPAKASEPDIPEWNELSLEFRSGFNPPRLDVHVYDDEPSRRFILVELKRYVEGDTLNDSARLEKILPEGIQLYYNGTRFRIDR